MLTSGKGRELDMSQCAPFSMPLVRFGSDFDNYAMVVTRAGFEKHTRSRGAIRVGIDVGVLFVFMCPSINAPVIPIEPDLCQVFRTSSRH